MRPVKREKTYLDPAWLAKTAKLAMKRGTAIMFGKNGTVYGILPKSGGSVNVFYEADKRWCDAVLEQFPNGAIFPNCGLTGGPDTAKALRPYANVRLPEDGTGKAWIDSVSGALHVEGKGMKIHSAAIDSNEISPPAMPDTICGIKMEEIVPKDIGKLLVEFTRRDDNRPFLKRIYALESENGSFIGATDGRSALVHHSPDIPFGFSIDPTLVSLFDITGYHREETDADSVIHTFRLSDGTLFVEKLPKTEPPNICGKIDGALAQEKTDLIGADALRKLVEDVTNLGLGAGDTWGGVVRFAGGCATVFSRDQPVADIDASVELQPDVEARFSIPILSRLARLNCDVKVLSKHVMKVACAQTETTAMIAAPMSVDQ